MWERITLFFSNLIQPVYLEITAADIEQGNVDRSVRCPATVAAQRVFGPNSWAGQSHISVYHTFLGKRIALYEGGKPLYEFTKAFDNFEPVHPIVVKLKRMPVPEFL